MGIIILIQLSDWFYGLKHSEITQKKIKTFCYNKTMVNFNKGCDVHLFFQEIIEAVSSIAKMWPKLKDWGDIWIKYLVNILLNKDLIVL